MSEASKPEAGCGAHVRYVALHVVVCPIACGLATWLLIERDAGEAKGWAFVTLTAASFVLSLLSALFFRSFHRSSRKRVHLAATLSVFAFLPLILFGSWILYLWAMVRISG